MRKCLFAMAKNILPSAKQTYGTRANHYQIGSRKNRVAILENSNVLLIIRTSRQAIEYRENNQASENIKYLARCNHSDALASSPIDHDAQSRSDINTKYDVSRRKTMKQ